MTAKEAIWLAEAKKKYISKGQCPRCKEHRPIDWDRSKTRCTICLNRSYRSTLKWILNLPENTCRRCGKQPIDPNRSKQFCTECTNFRVAREYRLREQRAKEGTCINCGAPRCKESIRFCTKCRVTSQRQSIRWKMRQLLKGAK